MNVAATFAKFCSDDYDNKLLYLKRLDFAGITATLANFGDDVVLVVRGTDSRRDWHDYNLRFETGHGDSREWAAGFLDYARVVYAFALGWKAAGGKLDLIIGHSLGAAAIQIVGPSLQIRSIGFAAPCPLYSANPPDHADMVSLYCFLGDSVCYVPSSGRHVVVPTWLTPPTWAHSDVLVLHNPLTYHKVLGG